MNIMKTMTWPLTENVVLVLLVLFCGPFFRKMSCRMCIEGNQIMYLYDAGGISQFTFSTIFRIEYTTLNLAMVNITIYCIVSTDVYYYMHSTMIKIWNDRVPDSKTCRNNFVRQPFPFCCCRKNVVLVQSWIFGTFEIP